MSVTWSYPYDHIERFTRCSHCSSCHQAVKLRMAPQVQVKVKEMLRSRFGFRRVIVNVLAKTQLRHRFESASPPEPPPLSSNPLTCLHQGYLEGIRPLAISSEVLLHLQLVRFSSTSMTRVHGRLVLGYPLLVTHTHSPFLPLPQSHPNPTSRPLPRPYQQKHRPMQLHPPLRMLP
jgi:hypothetical protein